MFNIPDAEVGEAIIEEIRDDKNPSVHLAALGYAIVLFNEIMDNESDAHMLMALPQALDALIDLNRIDLAMSLFIGLCADYDVDLPTELMQYAVFGPVAESFIIELEMELSSMLEEIEPMLKAICN